MYIFIFVCILFVICKLTLQEICKDHTLFEEYLILNDYYYLSILNDKYNTIRFIFKKGWGVYSAQKYFAYLFLFVVQEIKFMVYMLWWILYSTQKCFPIQSTINKCIVKFKIDMIIYTLSAQSVEAMYEYSCVLAM